MLQEQLFTIPKPAPQPAIAPKILGPCIKCSAPATLASASGNPQSIYCVSCGKCGGKTVDDTALGIRVKVCNKSVEDFVYDQRRGVWRCPCVGFGG